jgi:hypothetical protein
MVTNLTSTICFSGIIHLSLSSKTIQQNNQNFCLSPLMLENNLPLSGNTSAGANVLLQGVDPCLHSVPLHHINLKSDFVSGQVVVGVRPTLPVEDISLLFGIDMAGDKVNDHVLHSDGDISHYFIDKEQKSCLYTDED